MSQKDNDYSMLFFADYNDLKLKAHYDGYGGLVNWAIFGNMRDMVIIYFKTD